jgi:hypothetical protein
VEEKEIRKYNGWVRNMKNAWLDEIKVRNIVDKINSRLKEKFIGSNSQIEDWVDFTMQAIKLEKCSQRVIDMLISRYTFHYELNSTNEKVCEIEFVKLPWFV